MTSNEYYSPGTFGWVELATTDIFKGKSFYEKLLGWQTEDVPIPDGGSYTMARLSGKDVGGMYQIFGEQKKQGVPPHWLSYILVTNADEISNKANNIGGKVIKDPFDVMDIGRMSVIKDPMGAVFAVWQAKKHKGAAVLHNVPGSFCWNELATTNTDQAGKFYCDLFGWTAKVDKMGNFQYVEFINGDRQVGGMLEIQKEWGNVPTHWLVYFAVKECDQAVETAKQMGATVLRAASNIPKVGRFAVLQDPQKAVFALIKLDTPTY